MTERPIIFSAPMVRALLAGTKTQTRRILKPQPACERPTMVTRGVRFAVGDRLWVRETAWICPAGWTDTPKNPRGVFSQEVAYVADDVRGGTTEAARDYKLRKTPAIHMPRWASRITLAVTDVRVERLHEISEADCWAEGVEEVDGLLDETEIFRMAKLMGDAPEDARSTFAALWNSIHGQGAWEANPWVVALTFKVEAPE